MVAKKQFDCTRDTKSGAAMMYLKEIRPLPFAEELIFFFYYGYEDLSLFLLLRAARSVDGLGKREPSNPDLNQNDAIVTLALCEFK